MYVTPSEVSALTGYSVDDSAIRRAQAIVEVMSGRPESLVTREDDKQWLMYACAWQAAYMEHGDVYQQANVDRVTQDDSSVTIGDKVYAVSRLTVEAIKNLSWRGSRSVKTKPYDFKRNEMPWWWTW